MYLKLTRILLLFTFLSNSVSKEDNGKSSAEDADGKSSLVFVFDTTGSMHNDLKQLREGAEMILNTALEESGIIGDFVFVPFHDPAVGPATVTRDKEVFQRALDEVSVYGGGDCPEKSLGGIQLALGVSGPRSFVYVFTDATAGDHRLVGKVLDQVQRKQTQVVFVLTGHCNDLDRPTYQVYRQVAAASGGQIFNLNKTSVHKVLDFVKSSIKGRTVNLGSSVNPAGSNYTQAIPVDGSVGEVTVSVSGAAPRVTVVDPAGETLAGPPRLVTTLDLAEIMVVKVIEPEPGNWSVTVGSEEEYSVRVVGLSNLSFSHGFSVQPAAARDQASYRPLQGTYNHMLISLSQPDLPVSLEYAEVVSLAGKTLFELPLTRRGQDYVAEAFIPPDDFFYIAINGKDENGHELRRVGATAVQAKPPDVPYLVTRKKIKAHSHSRVVLKCNVESLVPVTAMWTKYSARIQAGVSSLQTTTVEYVIEDMTEADVGRYVCSARNVAGVARVTTHVVLLVDPPVVSLEPSEQTLQLGSRGQVSCTVVSEALLFKFQFIVHNNESHSVIDIAVEPNLEGVYTYVKAVEDATLADAGNYTCLATNRGGSSNKTAIVNVQAAPTAQIVGPHELSVKFYNEVPIYCLVENSDAIQWSNNGTILKELKVNGSFTDYLTVNVTDDGMWTCKAVRGKLEASDSVRISLVLSPSVRSVDAAQVTVPAGTAVDVACEVRAAPMPRVRWHRARGEDYLQHTLTKVKVRTYKSTLHLNSSAADINGTYYCVAENSAGKDQDAVSVLVTRKMVLKRGFNDTSVKLYQRIKLPCNIDAYPPPTYTWYHNDTTLALNDNVHTSEDGDAVIEKVDFDDLGLYSCVAENGHERMEVNGTLNVFGLDAPALLKDQPGRRVVKQGDSAILTCSVSGSPKPILRWEFKSSNSSEYSAVENSTNDDGSNLTVNNVTANDAGAYRCVAENVIGRDEFQTELIVNYPPHFKSAEQPDTPMKPIEVEAGGKVNFTCEAVGSPPPIVLWHKNGRPVVYGKNIQTAGETLVIDKVSVYDTGVYNCNAKSPMGSVERNFTLFVYVSPKISPPTADTEQEILEGQLVELPCEVSGMPSPEVLWTHNGDPVVTDDRKYIDEFGIRFVANLTDFGDYTCVAKNKFGNNTLSYSLFIWVPPYIEPPLEVNTNILAGHNVTLQCDVVGFPVPSITWEYKDKVIQENTTNVSFNDIGNLNITNANSNHEGLYSCVAENIAGDARKVTYLTVNEPPKILEDEYTGPYLATNMDSALTVTCNVAGKPKPFVMWSRDGVYLDKDERYNIELDGALTIKSPTEDMSGNYTCIAKNIVATTNKTVEVTVYTLLTQMQSEASHPVVTVMEHTNTSIECPMHASLTDTVKWYKDATLVSTGSLEIMNISREGQTTYACVVSNAISSAYSAISLSIEWPPKFVDDDKAQENTDKISEDLVVTNVKVNTPDTGTTDNKEISASTLNMSHATTKNISSTEEIKNENLIEPAKGTEITETNATILSTSTKSEISIDTQSDRGAILGNRTNSYNITNKSKNNSTIINNNKAGKHNVKGIHLKEVVEGDDTYLDCSVDAKPIAKTRWLFNSKPLVFADRARLSLLNVHISNAGFYKCVVGNKHGTVVKEFKVNVMKPPFISEFDMLDVLLMEGVNATLDCDAKGTPEPTVEWTFNNTNWVVDNSSLVAANVSGAHAGLFRCDARNRAGHAYLVYKVGVVVSAKIEDIVAYHGEAGVSVTGSVEAKLGSHIRVACKSSGTPTPSIQWLRNGKLLSENQHNVSYADLTIDGVPTSHAGVYSCVVSNEGGNDERAVRVEVLEPPKIFRSLFETGNGSGNTVSVEVLSGQAYYLHCHAYGNPVPELYWFRDGLPLMLFDSSMVSAEYGEVLEARRAAPAQAGTYTCVARNKAGNSSVSYLVDVLVPPPQPKEASHAVSVRAGQPLTLACPAEGSPAPLVTWNKHPYTEIGEHTPRVTLSEDNLTLSISSTQVSDSGNYSCTMTNKAGATEVSFDVTIAKPPSIAGHTTPGEVEDHVVALRKSIVLKCEVDGHPLPKITWLKDTQQLSDSASNVNRVLGNSLLAIWRVTSRDAGQYICVAENSAGAAHTRYNLRVQVPGKWSSWGNWSYCDATCGAGQQRRARACRYLGDDDSVIDKSSATDKFVLDESACKGPANETRKCTMPPCEESPAGWSAWSRWSACSAACGSGTQARTRRCRAKPCRGDNVQIRKCPNLPQCESDTDSPTNDIIEPGEDTDVNNVYAPEAVFEMEPELVQSRYSPDVEEFYLATGTKQSTAFYDVVVTSNLDGSDATPCGPGFRLNASSGQCEDIDECTVAGNSCHATQVCGNTAGGYRCSCQHGLLSLGAGRRCMDINECTQGISGCEYACVNVVGGYVCACPHDMRLRSDKHRCYSVQDAASSYRNPYHYEDPESEYLSTSVEYPARYKHMRN